MGEILTTGALARATEFSAENIRVLEKNGVVRAQRDSNGRRLFTRRDIAVILSYKSMRRTGTATT